MPVEVQTFESPFGKARAVIFSDGTPWFVAKDVCEGLGLSGGSMSTHMGQLKPEQKQVIDLSSCSKASIKEALYAGRRAGRLMLISRGGFNDLVLESRKPVARKYRLWVTDGVLPALQDNGTFIDKAHPNQQLLGSNPTVVISDEIEDAQTIQQSIDVTFLSLPGMQR